MAGENSNCGCGCGTETILVPSAPGNGQPGPPGPQGPPGPPGPGVSYPIPADQISVTNAGFANAQEIFDFLLYVDMVINSFSITNYPSGVVEIGASVATLQFSWALNKLPTTQTVSGPNIVTANVTPGTTTLTRAVSPALNPSVTGTSYTYQIQVSDGVQNPLATRAITFLNNLYVGDANAPGSINSAFVNTLTKNLQASRARSYVSNAAGSQYAWYACRSALGTPVFVVNGFPGGFMLAAAGVAVTNLSGFTENYDVYRSVNPGIGPVNIVVS